MDRVPYPQLRLAERDARTQYPDAHDVKAKWTPGSRGGDIHVEIWTDAHHANVRAWLPSR